MPDKDKDKEEAPAPKTAQTKKKATKKKTTAKKKPAKATFDSSSFRETMRERSTRAIPGADGKPSKKKAPVLDVMSFSNENVIGHSTGVISSRSIFIDRSTGIGGIPLGRITEVVGEPGAGKTTLLLQLLAEAQARGGVAVGFDVENKWDLTYAKALGVDADKLELFQPEEGANMTVNAVLDGIRSVLDFWSTRKLKDVPLVIGWDSLGQTATDDEIGKNMDDATQVAGGPKQLKRAMRTIPESLARNNAALVVVNQFYTNIVTGFGAKFAPKKMSSGGVALRYAATLRLELIKRRVVEGPGSVALGNEVECRPIKNSAANPNNNQTGAVLWGRGFDNSYPMFLMFEAHKFITTNGSWKVLTVPGREPILFQGKSIGLAALLSQDPTLMAACVELYRSCP